MESTICIYIGYMLFEPLMIYELTTPSGIGNTEEAFELIIIVLFLNVKTW